MMLVLWIACASPHKHSSAGDTSVWTPPVFSGDGLPASEEPVHDTARPDGDTAADSGDTGSASSGVSFDIHDALFGWVNDVDYGTYGALILMEKSYSCSEVLGSESFYPDGIYFYMLPDLDSKGYPIWSGSFPECGSTPCQQAYWISGADYGNLDADLDITSYDYHYIEASWSSTASSGDGLVFYNCGDMLNWN